MTYKFNPGDTVLIDDIQTGGTVKLKAFSKMDKTNFYLVEYFLHMTHQKAIQYFRETKLRIVE